MRTLSTLATLLLGLAVVFWAPAANADCPHNDDDTHQHCGTPDTGASFAALSGVPAEAMSVAERDAVVGQGVVIDNKSKLISSASFGDSLLLFGVKLIDADSGSTFIVSPALGVHWESQANLEAALGGTPTLVVSQAGLAMIRTKPSVAN